MKDGHRLEGGSRKAKAEEGNRERKRKLVIAQERGRCWRPRVGLLTGMKAQSQSWVKEKFFRKKTLRGKGSDLDVAKKQKG